ncbi:AraC family transcriptional regulator [Paenibacillus sp. HB172176]|uniref:helix-turn-helix transcriptional regulator n=1 Tax=Paenibacillus sp. HB172176 TaxID=2493690 RepID=UPI00143A4D7C|nr:AraC family transcriptional regulator [Paenibacillus sp. HB172176]
MHELHYMTPTASELQLPIYLTGIGHWSSQERTYRAEGFHEHQLSFALRGEGILEVDGAERRVRGGDFFYLPPHIEHTYYAVKEPWEVLWLTFEGHYAETLLRLSGLPKAGVYQAEQNEALLLSVRTLFDLGRQRKAGHGTQCSKLLYGMLLDLRQQLAEDGTGTSSLQLSERLQPVLSYIEEHYKNNLKLSELARLIHVTPQHLCLLFKRSFQLRPIAYVNRIRINKSKELILKHPDMKINEIAREIGFDNSSYFNAVFKAQTGTSPNAFKKSF